MPIYRYQKVSDQYTTYGLLVKQGQLNQELCTVDGVTYHFVDGPLPEQHAQIAATAIEPDAALKSVIRANSAAIKRIDQEVINLIRSRYSIDEELYLARIAIGSQAGLYELEPTEGDAILAFGNWAEECRAWGRAERAKFGV